MDEQALNELLECSVCLERLDLTSKVLPCQHTFCRRCLEEIVSTKNELRCPECRTVVTIRVEDLPPNILLVRLLEGLKTQGQVLSHTSNIESPAQKTDSPSSSSSNIQSRPQRQSVPCAKALYNYEAKESGDLSFKKNDIVVLRKQIDDNWYHGELNSQHGFFPINYVEVIVPLPQLPQCQALYDFDLKDEKEKDCLSFQKDETLTVIRKVDDNWIEGKKGDKIGIFPVTFVKLNDAAKGLLLNSKSSGTIIQAGGHNSDSTAERTCSTTSETHRVTSPSVSSVSSTLMSSHSMSHTVPHPTSHTVPHPTSQQQKRHSFTLVSQKSPSPPNQHQRRSLELGNSGAFSIPSTSGSSAVNTSTPSPLPVAVSAAVTSTSVSSSTSSQKLVPQVTQASKDSSCSTTTVTAGSDAPSVLPSSLTPVYSALYSYKPHKNDELELTKGESYSVSEKCQDGWFKGQCLKSGLTGVFPGNYVQPTRHQSAFKPVSSALSIRSRPPLPSHCSSDSHNSSDLSRTTSNQSPSSSQSAPPPLLPRAPKTFTSSQSSSGSHSSRSCKTAITVPAAGFSAGSSKSSSSSTSTSSPSATVHLPKRASHSSSPNTWNSSSLAAMQHSMSALTNITPPNVVLGATGDSHHSHSSKEKKEKKEKHDRHDKEWCREKRDKEKKSLVKRLASKSKKSKSPGEVDTTAVVDGSASHVRSGSYPESAVGDISQHKKTGSFDSSPPPISKPSRPKPLAREKYTCIVPYPPQSEHELDLQTGDVVYVHKKREDGWFKGTLARSGKTGLFPGSFVEKCD